MWWRVLTITLAFLLISAHFLRFDNLPIFAAFAAAPLLLFFKRPAITRVLQLTLVIAAIMVWGVSGYDYVQMRISMGEPWIRLLCIMSGITLYTLFAAICCNGVLAKRQGSRFLNL